MRISVITIALLLAFGADANLLAASLPNEVDNMPIQYQGRVMPFKSFAVELIQSVTGKLKLRGQSPSETVLYWMAFSDRAYSERLFDVGFDDLRREAGLDLSRRKFSLDELISSKAIVRLGQESSRIKSQDGKPTRVQSEAENVFNKMGNLYALLTRQIPGFIPLKGDPDGHWASLGEAESITDSASARLNLAALGLIDSYRKGDIASVGLRAGEISRLSRARWSPGEMRIKRFDMEAAYNKYKPIIIGRTFYLLGLMLLVGSLVGWSKRLVPLAGWLVGIGLSAHIGGMIMRAYIGDRAPWSNFYESMLAITGMLVLFGLLFSAKQRLRGVILGGVAFSGFFALMLADRAGLSPGVDTLVPALQSYWLTIHVIIILSGYAAAALAMILGHVSLGIEAFKPRDRSLFIASTNAVYRAIQIAMLLLFVGTILGGVWAHEAWGRYWGWDPKETWALISWFGYLGVAHARFNGWLSPRRLSMAAIGVFPLILMTYYGVNYLLSGLHSYAGGESAQVPPLLIGFLLFEAAVLVAVGKGWHLKLSGASAAVPPAKPKVKKVQREEREVERVD